MARSLRKADKLTNEDIADAPAGKWKDNLLDGLNAVVDVADQLRSPGLQSRVGSSYVQVNFSTQADWVPVILQPDWASASANICPTMSVRKYDDGTAEVRGNLQWLRSSLNYTAAQIANSYAYPDSEYLGYAMNLSNVPYRFDVYADGYFRLDKNGTTPASATMLIPLHCRWQCADPTPPPHLASPILVSHGLDGNIGFVGVRKVFQGTANGNPVPIPRLCWFDKGNGQIQINNVLGLPGGMQYTMQLVIVQE